MIFRPAGRRHHAGRGGSRNNKGRMGLIWAILMALLLIGAPALRADTDIVGPLASDQSVAVASEVTSTPASAVPVSVVGPVGSYTTELWPPDATDSPYGLWVINSTAFDTAGLTGIVIDASTGLPVAQATVALYGMPGTDGNPKNSEILGPKVASTATRGDGSFAFINMPVLLNGTTAYSVVVEAPGFGAYTLLNDTYLANLTYQVTVALTSLPQAYDESIAPAETGAGDAAVSATTVQHYAFFRRPPPTIRVAFLQTQSDGCTAANYTVQKIVRYPWKYYLLHVAVGEIDTRWHLRAWKAVVAAAQNYAWYHENHPPTGTYDLNNTTQFQCFRPDKKLPSSTWKDWVDDLTDEHIAASGSGAIQETQYRAGTYHCTESAYPADGDILSQQGSRAKEDLCGVTDWRNIDEYYYTGSVADSISPPAPNTSFSQPASGEVSLNFPSQTKDSTGQVSNVGWEYVIERYQRVPDGTYGWVIIHDQGWDSKTRTVPTSFTFTTDSCALYRAKAANPVGTSPYASFNGDHPVCPGS